MARCTKSQGHFRCQRVETRSRSTCYVNIERAEVVVSAPNIDAALPKARAKLKQDAKVIDAMILTSSLTTNLDGGKYKVDLDYYTGKLKFFPKPTLMLGQQ